jgi:hypothetical protein
MNGPSLIARARRLGRMGLAVVGVMLFAGAGLWSVLAVWFSNLPTAGLRLAATTAYALALLALMMFVRPWRRARRFALAAIGAVAVWFLLTPPSNDRDWQPDVALLPYADFNGDQVTLHHLRNCDYRTETDFTVRHYDRTLELAKLTSVDLFVVYWGSPWIAHTMLSFGFEDGDPICFSIETRKEKGENYSALKGFFRQFELTYVIGDERDLVRLRTNFRGEQVYLYHLNADRTVARLVFLDYLRQTNRLKDHPEWYNALTSNCTTNIRGHTRPYAAHARWDWRILLNGQVDAMAYERGTLDQSLPFAGLRARSRINDRARAANEDPAFSRRIREGLPGFDQAGSHGVSLNGNAMSRILLPRSI